jgi:trehalose synthase
MPGLRDRYAEVVGEDVINQLTQLASRLEGARVVHVNSTKAGGGVAEILSQFIPLKKELGIDARWEVIKGDEDFFKCTKGFHNALQGRPVGVSDALLLHYEETNAKNASDLRSELEDADWVFIHDPQPAALLKFFPKRKGKWIWRCHIDVSKPYRPIWRYLRNVVSSYDASVFSLATFAQQLPHVQYLVPPSIDPFSDKNRDLDTEELERVYSEFGLDPDRPIMLQVSRFDAFKDPLGVIQAYRLAKRFAPQLQLVLAGGLADDDPEGDVIFKEVMAVAEGDSDIHLLLLPSDAHVTINALQRSADIVLQKSIREGFGLTVSEAMWKGKPILGGDTGGIRLQVINHHTGFLVSTPEGAALRIRYLLDNRSKLEEMGTKAKEFVRENFLLTRQLREVLTLMLGLTHEDADRINLE